MRTFLWSVATLWFSYSAVAQNGSEPVLITDMLKIKTVGNITASRDGSKAAFTVTSIEADENNKSDYKYITQIYTIGTSGTDTPIQLTTTKEGASQPSWSPDGSQLAFVRTVEGKPQIFLLSFKGGEALQLTKYKYGASSPRWSPDGKQILFSSSIPIEDLVKDTVLNAARAIPQWPYEKPGYDKNEQFRNNKAKPDPNGNSDEIQAYLDKNVGDKKAIVLNKLNFQNEMNISAEMNFNQLFIIDVANPGSQPRLITKMFHRYGGAAFLPDGKQIIMSGDIDSLEAPDRSQENQIYITDVNGKKQHVLLGQKGKTYTNASVSTSGKWIAFLQDTTTFSWVPKLSIMPMNGTAKDIIVIPFDRNASNLTWSLDEKYLFFTAPSNGGVPIYRLTLATRKIETLSTFDAGVTSFDVAGTKLIFSKTQVSNPSEIYVADGMMRNEKQLSDFNSWVKSKKLSKPEKKSFVNERGLTVEYWVMKPAQYKEGEKYPLLLEIHGGPTAMWGPGEASMWHEFQFFCSKGYGVVYSNPRGSGGYGIEFMKANIMDWGAGPARDALTALDKAVAEGWADASKLLITGGSYAGYLTAWIISHDNRFRAACSQRGVYDLATFFGEGNAWRLVPRYFGGYPWEEEVRKVLVRESPITYVHNIKTPYIIFHGANDRRTGFVQGEMMFRSLKVLQRPVEYVVHPGATHEITRSGDNRQRIDQMLRTYEFFERYLSKDKKLQVAN
jgi:dipeptidyl aminopeptidase/acylaminoacyl peptidase